MNLLLLLAIYLLLTISLCVGMMMLFGGLSVLDLRDRLLHAAFHTCMHEGEMLMGVVPRAFPTAVVRLLAEPTDQRRIDWEERLATSRRAASD